MKTPAQLPAWRGLSGKLLVLTISFVLIGEVLIFPPSLANARLMWLKNRIIIAETAALAVEAAGNGTVPEALNRQLLRGAGAHAITVTSGENATTMSLSDSSGAVPSAHYDLRDMSWLSLIRDALVTLTLPSSQRVISVTDVPPVMTGTLVTVVLDEAPLHAAMIVYARNILILSVMLSMMVAGLVFLALNLVLVQPMRQLTRAMLDFAENPEDMRRIIVPSGRRDEIGLAEQQLNSLQRELSLTLNQKSKLAVLGLAVSKISHDLRNMLSSAQLLSDRLAATADPTVQRIAPKLVASLDRAISLCAETLRFGRVREEPKRRKVELAQLAREVIDLAGTEARGVSFAAQVDGVCADADPDHLFRILTNLVRNASQAAGQRSDGQVRISAVRKGSVTVIEVADNGPGVPEAVLTHVFEAWQGSGRNGGTGLGLAIARDLARAHGGDVILDRNGSETVFRLAIPDRGPGLQGNGRPAAE